jgi:nitrate/nitrite transport system ATP-binding protein
MNHDATFKRLSADVTRYLMDVGIAAKTDETRRLPNVTPMHGIPRAVATAQEGLIEDRFLDYSQLCILTMTAGLNNISSGAIKLDGYHIRGADPERAVVFQSPSLFPWLTARENVSVGVDRVYPKSTRAERQEVVEYYLERVGLADLMDRAAADLSNGMKQRVGIARAFALMIRARLEEEPFWNSCQTNLPNPGF